MKRKSVTLIELIIVMVVIGIVVAGFSVYIAKSMDLWKFLTFHNEISNQLRVGVIRMGRDIRQIKKRTPSVEPVETATSSALQFLKLEDAGEVRVKYLVSGSQVLYERDENLDGTFEISQPLLSDVNSFSFSYYDRDGAVATSLADVHMVRMDVTLAKAGESITLHYEAFSRNFKF